MAPQTASALARFLESVEELSLEQWLRIADAALSVDTGTTAYQLAGRRLDAAIASRGLGLTSWFVRDAVDTAVQEAILARRIHHRPVLSAARAAREAVYRAAMALALRDWLSRPDYDILSATCRSSMAT